MVGIKTITIMMILASSQAYAMQKLEDEALSSATGQDGITITLDSDIEMNRFMWIDNDGLQPIEGNNYNINTPSKGVLSIGNETNKLKISGGQTRIKIDSDGGSGSPFLNLNVQLPDDLSIETGGIYVSGRDSDDALIAETQILDNMVINLGGLEMNIQLGNAPQSDMMRIYGVINNGIRVSNFGVMSSDGAENYYAFKTGEILIKDAGAGNSDLTFNGVGVSVVPSGLSVTPSAGKQVDVAMQEFSLGGTTSSAVSSVGNVFISGLGLGGTTLTISGH